jgi:hypothetical protein
MMGAILREVSTLSRSAMSAAVFGKIQSSWPSRSVCMWCKIADRVVVSLSSPGMAELRAGSLRSRRATRSPIGRTYWEAVPVARIGTKVRLSASGPSNWLVRLAWSVSRASPARGWPCRDRSRRCAGNLHASDWFRRGWGARRTRFRGS